MNFLKYFLAGLLAALFCTAVVGGQGLTPLPDRPEAPDLVLTDLDGETHRLSDYRGQVVIINFWATWCPPCREEMPSMQRAWEQVQDEKIAMLAVDVGESEETVFAFLGLAPVEFPLLLDQDSKVTTSWPVKGLPTTYVVDPQGRLAYRAIGGREWDDPALLEAVRQLHGVAAVREEVTNSPTQASGTLSRSKP